MKYYFLNSLYLISLFFSILIHAFYASNSLSSSLQTFLNNEYLTFKNSFSPLDIENFTSALHMDKEGNDTSNIKLDIQSNNPLETLKLKKELENIYNNKQNKNFNNNYNNYNLTTKKELLSTNNSLLFYNFKEQLSDANKDKENSTNYSFNLTTKPTFLGKKGNYNEKQKLNGEEIVQIGYCSASSIYNDNTDVSISISDSYPNSNLENSYNKNQFYPNDILKTDKFWCSEGNHNLEQEVKFTVEFEKSFRLSSMWIHWAFAPGKFSVKTSNKKKDNQIDFESEEAFVEVAVPWRESVKNKDISFWKSVLSNPSTRWNYKSFDERIVFDRKVWAKYVQITMKFPVNQYYGIYSLEFYTLSKTNVIIKSKMIGENLCLSLANGIASDNTPIVAKDCIENISHGDNRDVFILNSNGFITTYKENKCVQSPVTDVINVINCGIGSEFKDNREKWLLDFDGKIRSKKEEYSCLTISNDRQENNYVNPFDFKATSSSTYESIYNPNNVFRYYEDVFWISNLIPNSQKTKNKALDSFQDNSKFNMEFNKYSNTLLSGNNILQNQNNINTNNKTNKLASNNIPVIFEVYFNKYALTINEAEIKWKYPPEDFQVLGLLVDNYWRSFYRQKGNTSSTTIVKFLDKDLLGIKIIMKSSSVKISNSDIYGISNFYIRDGAKKLSRMPCDDILYNANLFDILDVFNLDNVPISELNNETSNIHKTMTKMKAIQNQYSVVPKTLISLKSIANKIREEIDRIINIFDAAHMKMIKVLDDTNENISKIKKNDISSLGASEFYPSQSCFNIIKTFPSKRSGYYWIQTKCMIRPLKVFCDFDSYSNKKGLDYYIFNNNQSINTVIKDIKSQLDIYSLCASVGLEPLNIKSKEMLFNIYYVLISEGYNLNSDLIIPVAYDYSCDYSKCSEKFQPFTDRSLNSINQMVNEFKSEIGSNVKDVLYNNILNNLDSLSTDNNSNMFTRLNINNTMAFGKIESIIQVNLATSKVSGVICSSNQDGTKEDNNFYTMMCDTILRGTTFDEFEIFTTLKIKCPPGCQKNNSKVFGNELYTDNSSICKAAIHSGIIDDTGGYAELRIEKGLKNYVGKESNNILSLNYNEEWNRSFSINKYNPYCPVDKIKDYKKSFISYAANKKSNKTKNILSTSFNKKDINSTLNSSFLELKNNENEEFNDYFDNNLLTNKYSASSNNTKLDKNYNKQYNKIKDNKKEALYSLIKVLEQSHIDFNKNLHITSLNKDKINNINNFYTKYIENLKDYINTKYENIDLKYLKEYSNKLKYFLEGNNFYNNYRFSSNKLLNKDNPSSKVLKNNYYSNDKNLLEINVDNKNTTNKETESPNSKPNNELTFSKYNVLYKLKNNSNNYDEEQSNLFSENQIANYNKYKLNHKLINGEKTIIEILGERKSEVKITTEVAQISINALADIEKKNLNQIKIFGESFKKIVGQIIYELDNLSNDKDKGLNKVYNSYYLLKSKKDEIKKYLQVKDKELTNNKSYIIFKISNIIEKLRKLNLYSSFIELYSSKDINIHWQVFNSKKSMGKKPVWEYYSNNKDNHANVIQNKSNGYFDNLTGSHLILKNKDFYDFEFKFTVFIRGNNKNVFGTAFKYKNNFSYYIFEISNQDNGFKRIRKFTKSNYSILAQKHDGGILENTWYNIKIITRQSNIKIYMQIEEFFKNNTVGGDKYDLIFDINDNEHLHGTIAFTSQNINWLIIDNISITPMSCIDYNDEFSQNIISIDEDITKINNSMASNNLNNHEFKLDNIDIYKKKQVLNYKPKLYIITPTCSRFVEDFKNSFLSRWKYYDPKDQVNGPSNWSLVKLSDTFKNKLNMFKLFYSKYSNNNSKFAKENKINNSSFLIQQSNIYSIGNNQEGTRYVLRDKNQIYCLRGKITIKAKAVSENNLKTDNNNGIISLLFRVNEENYYMLEISNKFVRLRKRYNSYFNLLEINETTGFKINEYFKLVITMDNNKFNAYFNNQIDSSIMSNSLTKIFNNDVIDNDISYGTIGVSTYKTIGVFKSIHCEPIDLSEEIESQIIVTQYKSSNNNLLDNGKIIDNKYTTLSNPNNMISKYYNQYNNKMIHKIKELNNQFDNNYSWSKCLSYPNDEEKEKYCNMHYSGNIAAKACKVN